MKRIFYSLSLIITICLVVNVSSAIAATTSGISYYNAGFPLVAKTILLDEIKTNTENKSDVCFYLGHIYFGENRADSAAFYFNKGLTADPLNALNTIGLVMLKVKSNPKVAEIEINSLLKEKNNKKNVDLYIAAGRAFLVNGVLDKALQYQELAKNIKSKYAPVYVLLGDIELAKANIGAACVNYEMAFYYEDTNKEAYIKYARAYKNVNPQLAIEKLNILKQKDPSFKLVDKELADIYYAKNDLAKAAEYYENYIRTGNANVEDLTQYATTLFFKGDYDKSLDVVKQGLMKAPMNPVFNRLSMYNNVALEKYDEALTAADLFFNKSNKTEILAYDHSYYGKALANKKQFEMAIDQYNMALKLDSSKVGIWKEISDMYAEKHDTVSSINAYEKYINLSKKDKDASVILDLGKLYYGLGKSKTGVDELKVNLLKADSLFAKVATLDPESYLGNYYRAQVNSALDPNTTEGLAKPYYEATAALIEKKTDASRYNSILKICYGYLGVYYFKSDDNAQAIINFNKVLAIEPQNVLALKVLDAIKNPVKSKK